MTYSQKLRDPRWQKLRLLIMERDGWQCQSSTCRSPENTPLHVHHREYLPGREPWEYPPENLVTLCERCHDAQHPRKLVSKDLIEGRFYHWQELGDVLGFQPHGYLTQTTKGDTLCGCFRLDYNPDAPEIVLPGTDPFIVKQAAAFAGQARFIPIFIKPGDFGWEYCGRYRVKSLTRDEHEISSHKLRAELRELSISMILYLEKAT